MMCFCTALNETEIFHFIFSNIVQKTLNFCIICFCFEYVAFIIRITPLEVSERHGTEKFTISGYV